MVYVTHDQLEASTFADKIALMYQGQIVQFGTPQELFEQPAHTFVGYFIGSPGMNIIEVAIDQHNAVFDDVVIPLNAALIDDGVTISNNIKIGIRPEFVEEPLRLDFVKGARNIAAIDPNFPSSV